MGCGLLNATRDHSNSPKANAIQHNAVARMAQRNPRYKPPAWHAARLTPRCAPTSAASHNRTSRNRNTKTLFFKRQGTLVKTTREINGRIATVTLTIRNLLHDLTTTGGRRRLHFKDPHLQVTLKAAPFHLPAFKRTARSPPFNAMSNACPLRNACRPYSPQ